jgi:hypothetical protein
VRKVIHVPRYQSQIELKRRRRQQPINRREDFALSFGFGGQQTPAIGDGGINTILPENRA